MDSERCLTCLYGDKCSESLEECCYYYPIDEMLIDKMLLEYIIEGNRKFLKEWNDYFYEEVD